MTKTKDQLLKIWFFIEHIPGWLRLLEKYRLLDLTDEDIKTLEEIDEKAIAYEKEATEEYYRKILPESRRQEAGFAKEIMDSDLGDELRRQRKQYLEEEILRLNREREKIDLDWAESERNDVPWFLRQAVYELRKPKVIEARIRRLSLEKTFLEHPEEIKQGMITQAEIARALMTPFQNLITFNRAGFALCPFHKESRPSFHLMKFCNRAYCFGCGWKGNVIDFVMATRNLSFPDAVRSLSYA